LAEVISPPTLFIILLCSNFPFLFEDSLQPLQLGLDLPLCISDEIAVVFWVPNSTSSNYKKDFFCKGGLPAKMRLSAVQR